MQIDDDAHSSSRNGRYVVKEDGNEKLRKVINFDTHDNMPLGLDENKEGCLEILLLVLLKDVRRKWDTNICSDGIFGHDQAQSISELKMDPAYLYTIKR